MSLYPGLPTPPPLNAEEYQAYVDGIFPDPSAAFKPDNNLRNNYVGQLQRKLGDTELSYFLPSRESGVNDMYLHLGFRAPACVMQHMRVLAVWAILRLRHPLLRARVEMHDYDDVRFVYDIPSSVEDVLEDAGANLEYRSQCKDELIDAYLNGPRTLSNDRLSYLLLAQPSNATIPTPPRTPPPSGEAIDDPSPSSAVDDSQFDLLVCASHFIGDGMALHQFANDFFGLLGSEKSQSELEGLLDQEWQQIMGSKGQCPRFGNMIPASLEDCLPLSAASSARFRSVASRLDYQLSQSLVVGGQAMPRRKHPTRQTVVPTISFPEGRTKAMLKRCKEHGVSISAALFAVCNVAWARTGLGAPELPALMYSALNMRPYLTKGEQSAFKESYWFLAIGYFNVVLPNFLPSSNEEKIFWHRARQAKAQSAKAAKAKLLVSRTREMAKERAERSRAWAKEDDEKQQGTAKPKASPPASVSLDAPSIANILPERSSAPSSALLGLSLLGNLDGMYAHAAYPSITLHTLTTGSRQRHGALLLFGYTFKSRLWISLGYDRNGFAEGVVDNFWKEVERCLDDFLG